CDRAMLDLLAEFLANANVSDPDYARGLTEVFSILEKGDAARYRTVADLIAKKSKDTSIRSRAERYLRDHKENNVAQYVPGTIDRAALRRQYARDALEARHPPDLGPRLAALPLDSSVDQQFALGKPDAVLGYQRRMTDGMLIHIRTPYLYYYYRGVGRVIYEYKNKTGSWVMRKVTLNGLGFEPPMPYRDFAAELKLPDDQSLEMTMLLSGDGPSTQIAAQSNHDRPKPAPKIMLDAAAELLLAKYQAPIEPDQLDAYAWLCRLLSHKGGPRYAKVLEAVASSAADEKMRKYAKLAIDPAPEADPAPYVPGSIKLEALRSAYPVPYPPIAAR